MAITTQAQLAGALAGAQQVRYDKVSAGASGSIWFSPITAAGSPGAGTLAGASTAAGVVPTSADAGFPSIQAFGAGNTGYLGGIVGAASPTGRARITDLLFKAGAYAFNAAVTLAAQPSYSARIPGADYKGTELWFEAVTAFTGNPTVTVTYTNQDGTAGRTTGAIPFGLAPVAGRLIQLPLQAGDTGIQKVETVTCTVATVGTFNILVLRPLGMIGFNGSEGELPYLQLGPDKADLPIVFATSAIYPIVSFNSAGGFGLLLNIIQG